MKRIKYFAMAAICAVSLFLSFSAGKHIANEENKGRRLERCKTLISFAISKTEDENLSEDVVLDALISNLYAAHEFCDDVYISAQLNDLWNTLIVDGKDLIHNQNALADQLRDLIRQLEHTKA